jgi:hypothetical protein
VERGEVRDEVSFSDYLTACEDLRRCADGLLTARPDEAALHYLPILVEQTAIIFSFVGSNMTARHVAGYLQTTNDYQKAKDVGTFSEDARNRG